MAKKKLTDEGKDARNFMPSSLDNSAPSGYAGPGAYTTAGSDKLSGAYIKARTDALYNAYGRSADAIAMMRLDPAYAAGRAAGLQMPGDGMKGIRNADGSIIGGGTGSLQDAGAIGRSANIVQPTATATYENAENVPTGKPSPDSGPTKTPPSAPQPTASTPPTSGTTLPDPIGTDKPETPTENPQTTPTIETTKGPRLTTSREPGKPNTGTTRDYNRTRGPTEQQKYDAEFQKTGQKDLNDNVERRDKLNRDSAGITSAEGKMGVAKARNDLQDEREKIKMDYDKNAIAAGNKDDFNNRLAGYQTKKGDTEIEQRTGEAQDRSQYLSREDQARGQGKVTGRNITYMGPQGTRDASSGYQKDNEKEMVTSTIQNKGTYTPTGKGDGSVYFTPAPDSQISLLSAKQNKEDAVAGKYGSSAAENTQNTRMGASTEKDASQFTNDEKYVGGQARFDADQEMGKPTPTNATYDAQSKLDSAAATASAGSNASTDASRVAESQEVTASRAAALGKNDDRDDKEQETALDKQNNPEDYAGPAGAQMSQAEKEDLEQKKKKQAASDYQGPVGKNTQQA